MHRAENALVVDDVFGEEVGPGVPILADHPGVPEVPKRRFDLFELEARHYSAACWPSGQE